MFDPALRERQMGRARETDRQIGNQEQVLPVPGSQNRHTDLTLESWRGLLRLGCAPLVAVVKPANLRYRKDGAAVQASSATKRSCLFITIEFFDHTHNFIGFLGR